MAKETLRAAKLRATRREYSRVFDDMNLPPLPIRVEWEGQLWVRNIVWYPERRWKWARWEREW